MSKENLEQFMNQISDSEELQARIGDEIDAESLIALGAEHGYEFTAEELQESAELSDEELEGVAGGLLDSGGSGLWGHANTIRFRKAKDGTFYECSSLARDTRFILPDGEVIR